MKKLLIFLFYFISLSINMKAQTKDRTIYSDFFSVKEERLVKIWTPPTIKYLPINNIIYVFDANYYFDYIAATVAYFCEMKYIPPTAVVGVYYREKIDRTDIGFNDDMTLSKIGEAFFNYLTKEVMPYVNNNVVISQTPYNIYLGHSYLGKYALYYIKNYPDFFDAYVLFSPADSISIPEFNKENLNNKRFFISVGAKDTESRITFADKLHKKFFDQSSPKSNNFEIFDNADHLNIVQFSFPLALQSIYNDYISYMNDNIDVNSNKNASGYKNYIMLDSLNQKNYKCGFQISAGNIIKLFPDTSKYSEYDLNIIAEKTKNYNDANLHEIIGYKFLNLNNIKKAKKQFELALNLAIKNNTLNYAYNIYRGLLKVYAKEPNGYNKQLDIINTMAIPSQPRFYAWYYTRGILHVENNEFKKGIADFKRYLENYDQSFIPKHIVYYQISNAYYLLHDIKESEYWTNRALEEDNQYEDAIEFKKTLKGEAENLK